MQQQKIRAGLLYYCARLNIRGTVMALDGECIKFRYWNGDVFVDAVVSPDELADAGHSKPLQEQ